MSRLVALLVLASLPPVLACAACTRPVGGDALPAASQSAPGVAVAALSARASTAPAATPVPADGALHVFATVKAHSAEAEPLLSLCATRGATFLGSQDALYVLQNGAFRRDAALEVGLPHDAATGKLVDPVDVYGSWPDDAWGVSTHYDIPPLHVTVYRWREDRWAVASPERTSFGGVSALLPWGKGGALSVDVGNLRATGGVRGLGTRAGRVPGTVDTIAAVAGFDDGVLVAAMTQPAAVAASALQLWPASGSATTVRLPEPAYVELRSVGARDVVLFGSRTGEPDGGPGHAYLMRFDGKALTGMDPPPGDAVSSYVDEPSGRAWALMAEGKPLRHTLWRREPKSSWQRVGVPAGYEPHELFVTGDGVVWVKASGPLPDDASDGEFALDQALLCTRTPTGVLRLGESGAAP